MSLLSMLEGLNQGGIRYVVIGGVAGTAHGSARITNDLDVCYDTAPENRDKLVNLQGRWQASLRGVERGLPFIMDSRTLADHEGLTLTTSEGDVDLFQRVKGIGAYADCVARSENVTVGELEFAVLNLEALIAAKRAAGRPRDIDHLRELEALLELRRRRGRSWPA